MTLRLTALFGVLLVALASAVPGAAQTQVRASLVAAEASVQPGRPFAVALRLQHKEHWHTYWINPGTGLATSLAWKLPAGWKTGEILWPAPMVLRDKKGNVVGNGYEDDLLLPVMITPPADLKPGTRVELKATADWLMCEDVCIPGNAEVSLSLPVAEEAPAPAPEWGTRIGAVLARMPRPDAAWTASAVRAGTDVTLTIRSAAGAAPAHAPGALHFFAADGLVAYDLPQVLSTEGGVYTLKLKADASAPADAKRLVGVVTAANGWKADGTLPGLGVDVAFAAVQAASAAKAPVTPTPSNAAPAAAAGSLAGTLLLAFLGGLILNLMPCVFPVLGIKILGFVNQAGHQRGRIVAHGLVFTGGVLASFWLLAGALAVLRAGGDQLGWGFQLQSAPFVYGLAVLLLVFGMNMSGVFEFGLSATAVGGELQMKSGYAGSFFTGVLATVVATPCSAPFLAPALGAALAVPPLESFAIFTSIAVGLSTPYLTLSIFPDAVKVLPRPGAWMETFKQFMAFPLYGTVGYLVWVLAAQTSEEGFLWTLLSLPVIALAVWIYGRWNAPGASAGRARFGVVGLVVVGAAGLWLGWPRPVNATATPASGQPPAAVWDAWSPEAVAKLRAEGRVIYVDFTARWCATCQTNKKIVFASDEVLRYFAENRIATLRADWTNKDPRITAELARFQRSAVPFNVIWKPGREEPVILPELLTPGIVLDALRGK
jgi:thiol:disulfide interchange protein/DsbC/DsbD-like thiol-disulfide interchange protein